MAAKVLTDVRSEKVRSWNFPAPLPDATARIMADGEQVLNDPDPSKAGRMDPASMNPSAVDPGAVDPGAVDPGTMDAGPATTPASTPVPAPPAQTPTPVPLDLQRDLDALREEARTLGYQAGYEEGERQARRQVREQAAHLEAVLAKLTEPLAALDGTVEAELVALAFEVAEKLVHRELTVQPEQILTIVRDAIAVLPVARRSLTLHLHPEDAQLFAASLEEPNLHRDWNIVEDPAITRGGCRVATENSAVDATVQGRLAALAEVAAEGEDVSAAKARTAPGESETEVPTERQAVPAVPASGSDAEAPAS